MRIEVLPLKFPFHWKVRLKSGSDRVDLLFSHMYWTHPVDLLLCMLWHILWQLYA